VCQDDAAARAGGRQAAAAGSSSRQEQAASAGSAKRTIRWIKKSIRACKVCLVNDKTNKSGSHSFRLSPKGVTKKPMGKQRVTEELRELLRECKRRGSLPADFDVSRVSAISLRRGGNSAAVAAGISGIIRASHGRWASDAVPNQNYTFLHRTEMVQLATALYSTSHAAPRP
jgi:hypothetical protein